MKQNYRQQTHVRRVPVSAKKPYRITRGGAIAIVVWLLLAGWVGVHLVRMYAA
ncbi:MULTISPECIES: hypothetical protein [Serratia]|uniref:hypothetical protein n=1 Tax=Serratia TaxID=613 RepID=UPI00217B0EAA|nr:MULTISPECIES: hypothetical protein [Serratia]CAI1003811.1 Uncharacterised protein [Serratia quinivorans]CAI1089940.1 Uncharacterised protein [Serratia quinivorans]CAI2121668.1 Uncharacterised protein [Serratia quinivorans]CAI2488576.1 Uncharacterised protein [Serratia liquefaciens]